jgi:hypothetical protein
MAMAGKDETREQTAKAERLARALRENLKRRKAQSRGRGEGAAPKEPAPRSDPADKKR